MPVRMPGKVGHAYRAGKNLSLDGADVGKRTWEDFLAERLDDRTDPLRSPASAPVHHTGRLSMAWKRSGVRVP
jgi:hypothetical protein